MTTVADPALEFDAETHTYRVDGRIVPSVTQCLSSLTDLLYGRIPAETLDPAIARGLAVHKATELEDYGVLDWPRLDPDAWPYVEAWQQFRRESGVEILQIEQRVWHPQYRYAGTFDRLVRMPDGRIAILEIKTAQKAEAWWHLQTSGYQGAFNYGKPVGEQARRRFSVQLKPDGKCVVWEHADPGDFSSFLSYLNTVRWEDANGYSRKYHAPVLS